MILGRFLYETSCSKGSQTASSFNGESFLVQLGVNKPSVIPCAAQLLKVLGVYDLTEGAFIPPRYLVRSAKTGPNFNPNLASWTCGCRSRNLRFWERFSQERTNQVYADVQFDKLMDVGSEYIS
jgi:hypothetical protein